MIPAPPNGRAAAALPLPTRHRCYETAAVHITLQDLWHAPSRCSLSGCGCCRSGRRPEAAGPLRGPGAAAGRVAGACWSRARAVWRRQWGRRCPKTRLPRSSRCHSGEATAAVGGNKRVPLNDTANAIWPRLEWACTSKVCLKVGNLWSNTRTRPLATLGRRCRPCRSYVSPLLRQLAAATRMALGAVVRVESYKRDQVEVGRAGSARGLSRMG